MFTLRAVLLIASARVLHPFLWVGYFRSCHRLENTRAPLLCTIAVLNREFLTQLAAAEAYAMVTPCLFDNDVVSTAINGAFKHA